MSLGIILLVAGIVLILVAVFGCIASSSSKTKTCCINWDTIVYSVFVVIVLILEIIIALGFMNIIGKYDTTAWPYKDIYEQYVKGVAEAYNECCKFGVATNSTSYSCDFFKDSNCTDYNVYFKTSTDHIESLFNPVAIVLIIFAVIEILGVIITCVMSCNKKGKQVSPETDGRSDSPV